MRAPSDRRHTTVREHMPSSHRRYADWASERIRRQAGEIGRNTAALVEIINRNVIHRFYSITSLVADFQSRCSEPKRS
jgi:hypothetical protein